VDLEVFVDLPTDEVADLVRQHGPKVCVFPVNGTRRWYLLEHGGAGDGGPTVEDFLAHMVEAHIRLYSLCFDHGIHTLLSPIIGPDILERPDADTSCQGMALLGGERFAEFYGAHGVRVRFYGDYRRYLEHTPHSHLCSLFEEVTTSTACHTDHRLFFGVCAHNAAETVADISIRFFQEHQRAPDHGEIVRAYYGESVEPVDLFIGFDRFSVFDMPLVSSGDEDLYFSVAPSPYLGQRELRSILYDHLYARSREPDYGELTVEDWNEMAGFYHLNRGVVMGTGIRARSGIWYPIVNAGLSRSDILTNHD
jgi:tuberculosinol/isotuberculosinol synthase